MVEQLADGSGSEGYKKQSCTRLVSVSSVAPQGFMLGPFLFNVLINALDTRLKCILNKFACYIKLGY